MSSANRLSLAGLLYQSRVNVSYSNQFVSHTRSPYRRQSVGYEWVDKRTHKRRARETLARNMRMLRAAQNISQEALSHETGINRTYVSSVERCERNVSIDNIEKIAKGLKTEVWKLLKPDLFDL
jgi:ribosome-binding protein aMBF1 (putative translation factor)